MHSRDGGTIGRAYGYKNLAGERMAVVLLDKGGLLVMTPKVPETAPTAGATTRYWEFNFLGAHATRLKEDAVSTRSFDAARNALTLVRASDQRLEFVTVDKPRDGLRYRGRDQCVLGSERTSCEQLVQVPLRGMGVTLSAGDGSLPNIDFLAFTIEKP